MNPGLMAIFAFVVIIVLAIAFAAWLYLRPSKNITPSSMDAKTTPIVQRFCSSDLQKRAFIVRQYDTGYKVVYQHYSEKVINARGDFEGWQSLPDHPVCDSLAGAVDIANKWVHADD